VVIGLLTYQAGASFQKIVETQGADIHHLMEALGSLRVLYRVQFVLILVAIILIAVGIVMVVVAGTAIGLR
jgi:hypothetical protein